MQRPRRRRMSPQYRAVDFAPVNVVRRTMELLAGFLQRSVDARVLRPFVGIEDIGDIPGLLIGQGIALALRQVGLVEGGGGGRKSTRLNPSHYCAMSESSAARKNQNNKHKL